MRITGGTHRSRILISPRDRSVRPTSDKVRKAMFDILGPGIRSMRFLDGYAGTGAVGLEAVSRGAAAATLIEQNRQAQDLIRKNTAGLNLNIELICGEFLSVAQRLSNLGRVFDLIFIDPPYRSDEQTAAIEKIESLGLLDSEGTVIVEHHTNWDAPLSVGKLYLKLSRRYGKTGLSFFTFEGSSNG